ncbi:riboflavin biosynthesis protein ribAB [gamma proteobacterium NOR5-3]|nr:riboflavin biosynthesis protein ribAB [gamma proteobacterium NOR5-3]
MALSSVPDLIEAIRQGRMVILMDDEDRENEGDLIIAAEAVTPEIINFFATEACGLICMPLTEKRARQLQLPLMVRDNRSQHETNFTVSIDAAESRGPGISAIQRAHTVRVAAGANASPTDIRQPGHIFPLVAKAGGVLRRAGHTEAGVDLARMAGFEPAALIVEIMNEDGTMARRPELEVFAQKHQLPMGTIADLIAYRSLHEQSIELVSQKSVQTDHGAFELHTFKDLVDDTLHFALTKGKLAPDQDTLVRVQPLDMLRDVFNTQIADREGWSLNKAMARIDNEGLGALILIGQHRSIESQIADIEAFPGTAINNSGDGSVGLQNYRIIGTGAQILQRLNVGRMRLMSAPMRFNALSGFNLEVVDFVDP